ncbi:unnamed protein product [Mytilus edulis]|uniref:Uncharacterized protein n=1 Tax=Mytilus edulis TaxID=6550 RepID=A0A8S3PTF6_MYTED|nr:unnamed protein product [Mytilus edulis]
MASERSLRPKRDIDWKKLHFGEALPIEKAQIKRATFAETFEVERLISRKISNNEISSFTGTQLFGEMGWLSHFGVDVGTSNTFTRYNTADISNISSDRLQVATLNSGKEFTEISDNKSRKNREFKSKAETALWFAESYGLVPQYIKLQSSIGEAFKVDFQPTDYNKSSFQDLPDEEKQKIKDLLFILEKFNVSESAYRELTLYCDGLPRKYLISQCRDDINHLYHYERTPGNIPGAYISLENEIIKYVKYQDTEETDKLQIKISGDGSRVSRISNFVVFSFSVITDGLTLSSKDQNVFALLIAKKIMIV